MTLYGYRYYDPETGRWASRDPLTDHAFFGQHTMHMQESRVIELINESLLPPYHHVLNDAINRTDSLGLAAPALAAPAAGALAAGIIMGCICGMVVDDLCAIMWATGYKLAHPHSSRGDDKFYDALADLDATVQECIIGAVAGAATGPIVYGVTVGAGFACAAAGAAEGAFRNALGWP